MSRVLSWCSPSLTRQLRQWQHPLDMPTKVRASLRQSEIVRLCFRMQGMSPTSRSRRRICKWKIIPPGNNNDKEDPAIFGWHCCSRNVSNVLTATRNLIQSSAAPRDDSCAEIVTRWHLETKVVQFIIIISLARTTRNVVQFAPRQSIRTVWRAMASFTITVVWRSEQIDMTIWHVTMCLVQWVSQPSHWPILHTDGQVSLRGGLQGKYWPLRSAEAELICTYRNWRRPALSAWKLLMVFTTAGRTKGSSARLTTRLCSCVCTEWNICEFQFTSETAG